MRAFSGKSPEFRAFRGPGPTGSRGGSHVHPRQGAVWRRRGAADRLSRQCPRRPSSPSPSTCPKVATRDVPHRRAGPRVARPVRQLRPGPPPPRRPPHRGLRPPRATTDRGTRCPSTPPSTDTSTTCWPSSTAGRRWSSATATAATWPSAPRSGTGERGSDPWPSPPTSPRCRGSGLWPARPVAAADAGRAELRPGRARPGRGRRALLPADGRRRGLGPAPRDGPRRHGGPTGRRWRPSSPPSAPPRLRSTSTAHDRSRRCSAGAATRLPRHRESVAWLVEHTPGAELVEIAGAGHGAHLTHPDAFAAMVRAVGAWPVATGSGGTDEHRSGSGMNILVTGSSGLIGTALVERLAGAGPHGHPAGPGDLVRPDHRAGVTDVPWDPAGGTIDTPDAGAGRSVRRGGPPGRGRHRRPTMVPGPQEGHPRQPDHGHLAPGRTPCSSSPSPPPVLVSASAVGFYGDRGDEELTEDVHDRTGFLAEVCRPGRPRPDRRPTPASAPCSSAPASSSVATAGPSADCSPCSGSGSGAGPAPGSQYRSWITLDDEVGVIVHCLADHRVAGPVNATAPTPATDAELAQASEPPCTGRPPWPCRPPPSACSSGPRWPTSSSSAASGSCRPRCSTTGYRVRPHRPRPRRSVPCWQPADDTCGARMAAGGGRRRPGDRDGVPAGTTVTLSAARRIGGHRTRGRPDHDRCRSQPGRPGRTTEPAPSPRAVRGRGPCLPGRPRAQAPPGDLRLGPGLRQRRPVSGADPRAGGRRPGCGPRLGPDGVRRRVRMDHRAARLRRPGPAAASTSASTPRWPPTTGRRRWPSTGSASGWWRPPSWPTPPTR